MSVAKTLLISIFQYFSVGSVMLLAEWHGDQQN